MKHLITFSFLFATLLAVAQSKLDPKDFNNLIAISLRYSKNPMSKGEDFANSIDSFRTPRLNPIVDALIATGKEDQSILDNRFLTRPNDDELMLWYVIREIHYNHTNKEIAPRPDSIVASEVLSMKIDSRWLIDNYYYRINSGLGVVFNEADLSDFNFDMEKLGLKDETEKAIFFLNMMEILMGGRLLVLNQLKKYDLAISFCDKMPTFNGKPYYYYKHFDYDDFEWVGYDKKDSYNGRRIGSFFNTLIIHSNALMALKAKKKARDIYNNSILSEPKYFQFSASKDILQQLYDQGK